MQNRNGNRYRMSNGTHAEGTGLPAVDLALALLLISTIEGAQT